MENRRNYYFFCAGMITMKKKSQSLRKKTVKWTPEKIKALRKQLGEKQEEFRKRFRLSIQAIQGWEQGKDCPSGPATVILDQIETEIKTSQFQPV